MNCVSSNRDQCIYTRIEITKFASEARKTRALRLKFKVYVQHIALAAIQTLYV